jgi:putative membrane protein
MTGRVLSEGQTRTTVVLLSVLVIGAVVFLYLGPKLINLSGLSPSTLPKVNALLNGACALVLISAWRAILRRNIHLHRRLMLTAVVLSILFLVSYVLQHGSFPSAHYGGSFGWIYYPLLVSHIILAAVIVPLVLITLIRALSARFDKHRKVARWTLPLWLYVSVTGVLVYLMCAPYY